MNDCLPIKTSWVQFYVLCDSLCHVNTCEPVVSSEYSLFGSVGRTSALLEARRLPEQPEEVQERSHNVASSRWVSARETSGSISR